MSPYSYNSSNELTATPGASYTYDHNGNVLTKTDASGFWGFESSKLCGQSTSTKSAQAAGDICFNRSANARTRIESAGLFAVVALFSSDGAIPLNFAIFFPLM